MKNKQKGSATTAVLLGIIVLLVICFGSYVYLQNNKQLTQQADNTIPFEPIATSSTNSGWLTYNDPEFSVNYPEGFTTSKETTIIYRSVSFFIPMMGTTTINGFGINIATTTYQKNTTSLVTNYNAQALAKVFMTLWGKYKWQQSSVTIDGTPAIELSVNNGSTIVASNILFDKNGKTYDISEGGPIYYQSPTFAEFYNSFKFTQ